MPETHCAFERELDAASRHLSLELGRREDRHDDEQQN